MAAQNSVNKHPFILPTLKGATKLYFMHHSCVVIILFNTDLYVCISYLFFQKSTFSSFFVLYSFVWSVLNSMFPDLQHLSNWFLCNQMLCDFALTLFNLLSKTKVILEKTWFERGFEFFKNISFIEKKVEPQKVKKYTLIIPFTMDLYSL